MLAVAAPSGIGKNWGWLAKLVRLGILPWLPSCGAVEADRCDIAERGLVGLTCPSLMLSAGTARELFDDASYPSSSESDESESTLFCCKSKFVRLRSVRFDAIDVLVCRLETLAVSVGGDTKLEGLVPIRDRSWPLPAKAACLAAIAMRMLVGC